MTDYRRIAVPATEAARMLSMSLARFKSLVKDGIAPAPIMVGSLQRWPVTEIEAFASRPIRALPVRRPKQVPLGPDTCHLYRHFDKEGRLLYVGISLSSVARLADHKTESHWFWQIARIEVTAYRTRASALKAERISIQKEKPLHNILHNKEVA